MRVCVYLPTIVLAHEARGSVGQCRRAPAVSLTGASGAAVLPTFLLQLLEPVMHHLPAGGLERDTHTHVYSAVKQISQIHLGENLQGKLSFNINGLTPVNNNRCETK